MSKTGRGILRDPAPLRRPLALSDRPDAAFHGAVNFALTGFSEVRIVRSDPGYWTGAEHLRSERQRPAKPIVGAKGCFADLRASLA
jgi:hypothetical protein